MKKKEKWTIYITFLIIYILLGIYNYLNSSQWIIDNTLSGGFLTLMFFMNKLFTYYGFIELDILLMD